GMSIARAIFLVVMYPETAKPQRETTVSIPPTDGSSALVDPPLIVPQTARQRVSNEIWNLPNSLTLFRIFLVPFLVVVLLTKYSNRLGLPIFLVAAITDFFYGY